MAYQFDTGTDWSVYLDNSIRYNIGMRAQEMNDKIGNHLFAGQSDYKFPDAGDIVTNRIDDLIDLNVDYKKFWGFRVSGAIWRDFAYYSDSPRFNPKHPAFAAMKAYSSDEYSKYVRRYVVEGGEFLDAFTYFNTHILDKPFYIKAGRLAQQWGNALFFGDASIAYSQSPLDLIKGFSQPGIEFKELFLPRAQLLVSTELTPQLAVSAQYFFEFQPYRLPEGGTYLGALDILFNGPDTAAGLPNDGFVKPDHVNDNFGVKVAWSPPWAVGELSFYYRQFDESSPWSALINPDTFHVQHTFAENVKMVAIAYERAFGLISTGFELNTSFDRALSTTGFSLTNEGATGTVTHFIANAFIQLGTTPLYDCGLLLAEIGYTYLNEVTGNDEFYNDEDLPGNSWKKGGATRNALGMAVMFEPQWLQVFPSVDLSMPTYVNVGLYGNPASNSMVPYCMQGQFNYSIGARATIKTKHTVTLQYNGYHHYSGSTVDNGLGAGLNAYSGGNGGWFWNDRGWVSLTVKTSF